VTKIRVWVEANGRGGWYDEGTVDAPENWAGMTEDLYAAHLAENIGGGYEIVED
jgi:hypothetical protein